MENVESYSIDMDTLELVIPQTRSKQPPTKKLVIKGHTAFVEKEGGRWVGWFANLHKGMEVVENLKKDVIEELTFMVEEN